MSVIGQNDTPLMYRSTRGGVSGKGFGDVLLDGLRQGHGANPDFEIEIYNVQICGTSPEMGLVLATYTEMQRGARNTTPADNARISTVLLQRDAETGRFTWLHIHETATDAAPYLAG